MKKLLFASLTFALFSVSCKKSDPAPTPGADSYMTTAAGTTWNYQTVDNIASTTTPYTLTSSNSDSTINGRQYHIYSYSDANGTSNEYYSISGSDYYQYTELSAQLPAFEFKYLVDNIAVGSSWTQPLTASQTQQGVTITLNATIKNTIVEKGASLTVNNKTYANVIKVKTEIQNPSITSSLPIPITIEPITQDINAYFAPKFGLVKRDFQLKVDINALGNVQNIVDNNTTTTLQSSSIQ